MRILQNGRTRAYRGNHLPRPMKCLGEFGWAAVRPQSLHTGPAGNDEKVKVFVGDVRKRGVRSKSDLASTGHGLLAIDRRHDNLRTGPSQKVDRRDGLDLFESRGQQAKDAFAHWWLLNIGGILHQILQRDEFDG